MSVLYPILCLKTDKQNVSSCLCFTLSTQLVVSSAWNTWTLPYHAFNLSYSPSTITRLETEHIDIHRLDLDCPDNGADYLVY